MATVKGQSSDLPKSMAEESDGSEEQKHKSIQSHTISFFGLGGRDDGSQSASQNQAPTKDMRVYYVLLTEDKQLHSFGPCRFNEEEWKKRYCPAQISLSSPTHVIDIYEASKVVKTHSNLHQAEVLIIIRPRGKHVLIQPGSIAEVYRLLSHLENFIPKVRAEQWVYTKRIAGRSSTVVFPNTGGSIRSRIPFLRKSQSDISSINRLQMSMRRLNGVNGLSVDLRQSAQTKAAISSGSWVPQYAVLFENCLRLYNDEDLLVQAAEIRLQDAIGVYQTQSSSQIIATIDPIGISNSSKTIADQKAQSKEEKQSKAEKSAHSSFGPRNSLIGAERACVQIDLPWYSWQMRPQLASLDSVMEWSAVIEDVVSSTRSDFQKFLESGFDAIKHKRRGKPHVRRFWVETDMILWSKPAKKSSVVARDSARQEKKFVHLNDVQEVRVGITTPVLRRSARARNASRCMSLISSTRTLDLELASEEQQIFMVKGFMLLFKMMRGEDDRELRRSQTHDEFKSWLPIDAQKNFERPKRVEKERNTNSKELNIVESTSVQSEKPVTQNSKPEFLENRRLSNISVRSRFSLSLETVDEKEEEAKEKIEEKGSNEEIGVK